MKHNHSIRSMLGLLVLVFLGVLFVTPQSALTNIRLVNDGQLPYYAEIERGMIYNDGTWAVIPFYRPIECIPDDFNLLDCIDFEHAFDCQPTTTDGFEMWKNDPDTDPAPILNLLHGKGAVPVWFVSWDELQDAIVDDVLTIGELAGLESLMIGYADIFQEMQQPGIGESFNYVNYHEVINAKGNLEDGTLVKVHIMCTQRPNRSTGIIECSVDIKFGKAAK